MTNLDFLKLFQLLNNDILFNKIIQLRFASLVYSAQSQDPYCNYAQLIKVINQQELSQLENKMISLKRQPAVYFEDSKSFLSQLDLLKNNQYQLKWTDSWMFFEGKINLPSHLDVKKIRSHSELLQFLDTFNQCYQKDDPQNPYGELGSYLNIAKGAWQKHHQSNKLEYFIAYKDDKPVAVSALTNYQGVGYISNIGSLPTVRGQGFGKLISLYTVAQSQQNKNKVHALATEEGHYPFNFYQRLGFKTKFKAKGYVKSNDN